VKIGERAVAWVEDEVREWVCTRIADRAAHCSQGSAA
jgi:predicted DNA-binding transcriptional regulator AlpA